MKLTLRRTATTGPVKVEDEIYLEDDSPPMVQYRINGDYDLPPGTPVESISTISHVAIISFPLIEKLCHEIFGTELETDY